jgi:putative DNA primase/helicase
MPIDADAIAAARAVRLETEIARRGIRLRGRVERTGPCPICGGRDRFSINTKKQVWHCRGCEKGGDGISMAQHFDGGDFIDAIRTLTGIVDLDRPSASDPVKQAEAQAKDEARAKDELADVRQRMAKARSIWQEAASTIEGTLVEVYLRVHRRLDVPDNISGSVVRFHGKCPFGTAHYPCMVALVRNVISDREQSVHRTALRLDGSPLKLDGRTARLSLGPTGGGAIKISDNAEVTAGLTIGEGLETVIAAMMAPTWYRPAWSLIDSGNLEKFPVLSGIESLTILVDHDRPDQHGRRAGQKAAAECAQRWEAAGREVVAVIPIVEGEDVADVASHRR